MKLNANDLSNNQGTHCSKLRSQHLGKLGSGDFINAGLTGREIRRRSARFHEKTQCSQPANGFN